MDEKNFDWVPHSGIQGDYRDESESKKRLLTCVLILQFIIDYHVWRFCQSTSVHHLCRVTESGQ